MFNRFLSFLRSIENRSETKGQSLSAHAVAIVLLLAMRGILLGILFHQNDRLPLYFADSAGRIIAMFDWWDQSDWFLMSFWLPLPAMVIGGITRLLGTDILYTALGLNGLFGGVALVLIYALSLRLFDRATAVLSTALAVFLPSSVLLSFSGAAEPLYSVLLLGAVLGVQCHWESDGSSRWGLGTASVLLALCAWTRYESWAFIGFFAVTIFWKRRKSAPSSRPGKIFFWTAFALPWLAVLFVCVRLAFSLGNPLDVVFVPLTEKELGFPQRIFLMPFILTVKYRYISSGLLAAFLFTYKFIRHKSQVVFLWAFGMLAVFFVASLTKVHSHELERNLMVPVLLALPFVGNVLCLAMRREDVRERLLNSVTISGVVFFVCVKLYFYVVQTPNVLPPVLENARRAGRVLRDHRDVPFFRFGHDSVFEYQLGPYWNFDAFRVFGDVRPVRGYYFPFLFAERVNLLSRRPGPVFYLSSPELVREAIRLRRGKILLEVPSKTGLWASPEQEEPAYPVRSAKPYSILYVQPKT